MADNTTITAGSGTTIATDDVSGAHYQRVKISDGTADGTTHLGVYAEDAAHSSGDTGLVIFAVRKDTAAALAGTDGDYIPLIVDSTGRLHIANADLATLAGAVSGTEVQVDVVASLPAGTNAIGKLAANDGVDIGNVDVASIAAGDNNIGNVDIASIAAGDNNIGNVDIASALPAGSNAIGKLAANSGVDIGDVDVTSVSGQAAEAAALPSVFNVIAGDDGTDTHPIQVDASGNLKAILQANSGVDIGDVDVASLSGAVDGPGAPSIDSYTNAVIDLAASTANQSVISAPGVSKQIWVYGVFMMADTAAGTVTFQDEDDTALSGTMAVSDEGGWVLPMSGNFAMPWIKVATNKALEVDTTACTVDGIITYAIVSV